MASNVGAWDRNLRIGVGLVLFGPQTSWGLAGLVPLVTGLSPAFARFIGSPA